MSSPYRSLPSRNFWKPAVSEQHPLTAHGLYRKKFSIGPGERIATAGSCFAQHISSHLRAAGYTVLQTEPPPRRMSDELARRFGYRIYSARYGNIYYMRQLLQLFHEAARQQPRDNIVWEKNGRYYDALRPAVEPDGLASPEEVIAQRRDHLRRVRKLFKSVDVFVFTFGLTEAWVDRRTGLVFPTCPGTVAGRFDPQIHAFRNFTVQEVHDDFVAFRRLLKKLRPDVRFLLTVSPVPLKASAADQHVLSATTYSKSVLRAAAGQLYDSFADVDYFPSYEVVASPWSRGFFFEPGLREVNSGGVAAVMRIFFDEHPAQAPVKTSPEKKSRSDIVCEEELLDAFQP